MMSIEQAIAQLRAEGTLVLHDGGTGFIVGDECFRTDARLSLRKQTAYAIAEAVEALRKTADVTWICRKCAYSGNKIPSNWLHASPTPAPDSIHQVARQKDGPTPTEPDPIGSTLVGSPRNKAAVASSLGATDKCAIASGDETRGLALPGDLSQVKALLKVNPDFVYSKDAIGRTPLHEAVSKGHMAEALVKLLLANSAEVDARDAAARTPLHQAAYSGHKDVAELLLANKARDQCQG